MCHSVARSGGIAFLSLVVSAVVPVSTGATPKSDGNLECPSALPEGISSADWSAIRTAYEDGRYAAYPVEAGFRARNPGQRWRTIFDGRGFSTLPDAGGWQWGLELVSYGRSGDLRTLDLPGCTSWDGARVTYRWDDTLEEWFLNDGRGLEHGYTVHEPEVERAEGDEPCRPLTFVLAVRGGLEPSVRPDGRGVDFSESSGMPLLSYSGLTAFDATGAQIPARFDLVDGTLRLSVIDVGASYPLTIDPVAQQAYLKASNTEAGDGFGHSVAVSGNTVVVGARSEDSGSPGVDGDQSDNSVSGAGAAYVFVRNGTAWSQQAYLKASNPGGNDQFGSGDWFGHSVDVSGNSIVVGAIWEDSNATGVNGDQDNDLAFRSGAAYVFVRSGTVWSQQAYLKASNTGAGDEFGTSVALCGDTLLVGAAAEDSNATGIGGDQGDNSAADSGAAYVFVRTGSVWSQQAYLKSFDTDSGDFFGADTALSGNTALVSAPREDSSATGVNGDPTNESATDSGAAYVYERIGTVWTPQAYLKASNTDPLDIFGAGLALSSNTAVVGAIGEDSAAVGVDGDESDDSLEDSGAAYVFVRDGSSWSQQAYLKSSNPDALDSFGNGCALSGDSLAISCHFEDSSAPGIDGDQSDNSLTSAGAVYLFSRIGGVWSQVAYVKAPNPGFVDQFGWSTSISGDTLIVSSLGEDSGATGVNGDWFDESATNAGAAFVFDIGDTFASYCTQTLPTSVPGCFATLSVSDPTLASGSWDATDIARSATLSDGTSLGIYIYTDGVGLGQSGFSSSVPYGTLCLQGFKRSAPTCAPLSLPTLAGVCNGGVMTLSPNCNSGALGIVVGEDVNVQLWYRDPGSGSGDARFSNAVYYTVL